VLHDHQLVGGGSGAITGPAQVSLGAGPVLHDDCVRRPERRDGHLYRDQPWIRTVQGPIPDLAANEAGYYKKKKYGHVFTVDPASKVMETVDWVNHILKDERDIVISDRPLEATSFEVDGIRKAYVFYESGLSLDVMYGLEHGMKRAVGFKLSEGTEVPEELASRFKFARQKYEAAPYDSRLLLRDQG
jgi:hypothetical protein